MSFSLSQCLFIAVLLKDVPPLFVPLYLIVSKVSERCLLMSPTQMNCLTPAVASQVRVKDVWFQLDNVRVRFESIKVLAMSFAFDILNISFPFSFYKYVSPFSFPLWTCLFLLLLSVPQGKRFSYYPNPDLFRLNRDVPDTPYRFKPGGVIAVEVTRMRAGCLLTSFFCVYCFSQFVGGQSLGCARVVWLCVVFKILHHRDVFTNIHDYHFWLCVA